MGNACRNAHTIESNKDVYIIWIDKNIDDEKNEKYIKDLKTIGLINIKKIKEITDAIYLLNNINFTETKIILNGDLYSDFIESFKKYINKIYVAPKIIIFTENIDNFLENNSNYNNEDNLFFRYGGIKSNFNEIKLFLQKETNINSTNDFELNKIDKSNDVRLTFEYIDNRGKLILPLFFKSLIDNTKHDNIDEYTNALYNTYSSKNKEVKKLLGSINLMKNIPIEILSKYYARLYTINSDFYKDMNKNLELNNKKDYLPFIKILYEGVKLKSLHLSEFDLLYRSSKISKEEIEKIKNYIKQKIEGLPSSIIFSNSFLSFTKEKKLAEYYLKDNNNDKNLSKVLFILEQTDNEIKYNLSTHGDIEDISFYPKEREVLFFPFSSFEIKNIEEKIINNEKIYEIKLCYLGKYLKDIEEDENITLNNDKIPDSEFKKHLINFGLIKEDKIEEINIKELYDTFKEYENQINNVDEIDLFQLFDYTKISLNELND